MVEPENRIHSSDCRCAHMAKAPSSPIVKDVVNVLKSAVLVRDASNIGFLRGERRVWCDEQYTVEPVSERTSQVASKFPFPLLKLIGDGFIVDYSLGVLSIPVGNVFLRSFNIWMATRSCRTGILPRVSLHEHELEVEARYAYWLSRNPIWFELLVTHRHAVLHPELVEWIRDCF